MGVPLNSLKMPVQNLSHRELPIASGVDGIFEVLNENVFAGYLEIVRQ